MRFKAPFSIVGEEINRLSGSRSASGVLHRRPQRQSNSAYANLGQQDFDYNEDVEMEMSRPSGSSSIALTLDPETHASDELAGV